MKIRRILSTIILSAATACVFRPNSPAPTHTILKPVCETAGTTQRIAIAPQVEIVLYLPPCFNPQAKNPYPVLYLLPGSSGNESDWFDQGADKVADASILAGEIPPFLIAAIGDISYDLDSRIVIETILPYIDGHYPVGKDRRYRAAAGGSYGGAAAYHLAFKHPELFSSAGIFGNGAAQGEEDSIRQWLTAIPKNIRPRVFLNSGLNDPYMLDRARVLIQILDAAGTSHTEIFSAGGHSYACWISNFPAYFRWLAEDWR
jgi:Enterochelin esterase and related enzymes